MAIGTDTPEPSAICQKNRAVRQQSHSIDALELSSGAGTIGVSSSAAGNRVDCAGWRPSQQIDGTAARWLGILIDVRRVHGSIRRSHEGLHAERKVPRRWNYVGKLPAVIEPPYLNDRRSQTRMRSVNRSVRSETERMRVCVAACCFHTSARCYSPDRIGGNIRHVYATPSIDDYAPAFVRSCYGRNDAHQCRGGYHFHKAPYSHWAIPWTTRTSVSTQPCSLPGSIVQLNQEPGTGD